MVCILMDPKYAKSLWCRNLFTSLTDQLRRRRIPFCEIEDTLPGDSDAVFVIASDYQWIDTAIGRLNAAGIRPILLCSQPGRFPGRLYSCVCLNIGAGMRALLNRLEQAGRRRPAIYGVNPHSVSDLNLADHIMAWCGSRFEPVRVFENNGSLQQCFADFRPHASAFDVVICTNDFAALSLVRYLRETGTPSTAQIVSCAKSELSDYYRQDILSLPLDFKSYGRAAVYVYDAMRKHPYISGLTVCVSWGEEDMTAQPADLTFSESGDPFYCDPVLREMLIVDKLLNTGDTIDRQIVDDLLDGCSYEQITERRFLAEGTVKYRLKKLLTGSGADSREEMLRLVEKYIRRMES